MDAGEDQKRTRALGCAGAVSAASGFKHNHERCAKTVELGKASVQKFLED